MNALSMPVRSSDRHEQEILDAVIDPDARISSLDRLSLRLGLWLLLRSSRRHRRRRTPVDHTLLLAQQAAERERERAASWALIGRATHL